MARKGDDKFQKIEKTEKECFIIMPFSDQPGYEAGHFTRVYEDIIVPACKCANVRAFRGDTTNEPNIIHIDIVKSLIDAPLAICDMSSRNPNVMFELGIRQAFCLPTVLMADNKTPQIFDVAPIRCMSYNYSLTYREVLNDQDRLSKIIVDTLNAKEPIANSILDMAKLTPAIRPDFVKDENNLSKVLQVIQNRMDVFERTLNRFFQNSYSTVVPGVGVFPAESEEVK